MMWPSDIRMVPYKERQTASVCVLIPPSWRWRRKASFREAYVCWFPAGACQAQPDLDSSAVLVPFHSWDRFLFLLSGEAARRKLGRAGDADNRANGPRYVF